MWWKGMDRVAAHFPTVNSSKLHQQHETTTPPPQNQPLKMILWKLLKMPQLRFLISGNDSPHLTSSWPWQTQSPAKWAHSWGVAQQLCIPWLHHTHHITPSTPAHLHSLSGVAIMEFKENKVKYPFFMIENIRVQIIMVTLRMRYSSLNGHLHFLNIIDSPSVNMDSLKT